MYTYKKAVLLICLLINALEICAQQSRPVLHLQDLLNQISVRSPELISDSASVQIRRSMAQQTRYNWLPSLKLNYQTDIGSNNNVAGPYVGFGIVPSNSRGVRTESNTSAVLGDLGIAALEWEIYNFGGYHAQNEVATSEVKVEENRFKVSKFELQNFGIDAYLKLYHYQNMLAIQQKNIDRSLEIRQSIQALARSGLRAGVDTSIAEAELSKSRLNKIELNNQYAQLQLQLAAISGLKSSYIIPDSTIAANLIMHASLLEPLTPDTIGHPGLRYYRSLYQSSLEKEKLVKKSYAPKIMLEAAAWGRGSSVDANDHFGSLGEGMGIDRSNYLVGIGITYNLFDIKHKQLQLHTQKLVSDFALKKLKEQQVLLESSSDQAALEFNTALQRLQEIPHQLHAAEAAYRQKLSLYKNGLSDIIELNTALSLLYRAETDYATAKYTFCRALFQRSVAQNKVDTFLKSLN
ncbi:TolC family protein [Pedobacter sp. HMWF019]|uniref:TolC family protein n=1 Tax=Pedobacter sp. HMWF019 TaxID=2056856 RepID=UPI000D339A56|nr:TolC family protein [Pedobacter sp. HMWF019]PTS95620.1 TolC family protein [Pedobacter sp. HMWF019]